MFYGLFTSKEDVCKEFSIEFEGTVLYAAYEVDGYEGSAVVIYVNQGTFWHVSGSHCSCFGLEGQFEPEEMPLDVLMRMVKDGSSSVIHEHREGLAKALSILSDMDLENAPPDTVTVAVRFAFC